MKFVILIETVLSVSFTQLAKANIKATSSQSSTVTITTHEKQYDSLTEYVFFLHILHTLLHISRTFVICVQCIVCHRISRRLDTLTIL